MAPNKSGAKLSSKVLTLTEVLKAYDVESVEQLDDQLLLQIYRLQDGKRYYEEVDIDSNDNDDPIQDFDVEPDKGVGTSKGVRQVIRPAVHPYKSCPNMWKSVSNVADATSGAPASSSKKRKSSEADDEGYSTGQSKSKGKERAVDGCSKDACRDNPRCLNHLGQEKWEDDKKAYEMFARQWGLGANPLDDLRDPDIPVGLKNLGATCYANSFLQVWFQDETFRAGVYSYRPSARTPLAEQPLYQLQIVFAALEAGNAKAYNPEALVKCLRLDETEQQDAQEFAKLFMEKMDESFKGQNYDDTLRNLLNQQFEGTISYSTQCSRCKTKNSKTSTFRELEITLRNNKSLEDLLEKSLETEYLDGDNKYRCETCAGLRDAKRLTEILTLPPVLHFSLLRFVFDPETMDRRKKNVSISFPKSIDMGKYLPIPPTGKSEIWYDLKGILLHRGSSAYSGHYTAHIYDAKHKDWYIFDDETVYQENVVKESTIKPAKSSKPVSRDSAPKTVDKDSFYTSSSNASAKSIRKPEVTVISDSEDERNANIPTVRTSVYKPSTLNNGDLRPSKRQKESINDSDDDREQEIPLIKSKDAYMLIYTKREAPSTGTDIQMREAGGIPLGVTQKIKEIERAQAAATAVYNSEEQECTAAFERMRAAKRSVYSCWNADEDDEAGYLVSGAELERWMVAEIDSPKKKKATAASHSQSDRHSSLTDEDDSVYVVATPTVREQTPQRSPSKPKPKSEAQNGSPKKSTLSMDVDESGDEELPELPASKDRSTSATARPNNIRSSTSGASSSVSRSTSVSLTEEASRQTSQADKAAEAGNGKSTTPQPARGVVSVTELDSSALLCQHDKMDPRNISKIKYISQSGLDALESLGVSMLPKLPVLQSQCKECVVQPTLDKGYGKRHRKHVSDYKACAKEPNGTRCWISRAWLAEWTKDKPSFHRDGSPDPGPEAEDYADDVFCSCTTDRRLQPDQARRQLISEPETNYLRQHFPNWHPPCDGDSTCSHCKAEYESARKIAASNAKLAKTEKETYCLKDVFSRGSHAFSERDYISSISRERCFAISAAWLKDWKEWLKKPGDLDRPGPIDLRPFFCAHRGLTADLNFPGDKKDLDILSTKEWEALSSIYTSFNDLVISVEYLKANGVRKILQTPRICHDCRNSARSNFKQIQIRLHFLTEDDIDASGQPKSSIYGAANQPAVIDLSEDIVEDKIVEEPGRRRSMRQSKKPGDQKPTVKRRPPQKLTVKRLDTLRDIRVAIEKKTEIPILYQKIFFRGREIEDASETIESIGITDQETLFVHELIAYDDDVDISQLVDDRPGKAKNTQNGDKKANSRSEGFAGTGLLGYSVLPAAEPEEVASIVAALPGTCTHCTFLNSPELLCCEMCDNPL